MLQQRLSNRYLGAPPNAKNIHSCLASFFCIGVRLFAASPLPKVKNFTRTSLHFSTSGCGLYATILRANPYPFRLIGTLFILLSLCTTTNRLSAQDFYYYKNEKINLELNTQYLYVLCNLDTKEKLNERVKNIGEVTQFNADNYHRRLLKTFANAPEYLLAANNHFAEIKLLNPQLSKEELERIASSLKNDASILNVSFHYQYKGGDHFAISNYVWVQLKDEAQIPLLIEEAGKINYSLLGQNPFMKDWVMLGANKTATLSPLKASQQFNESAFFIAAEPDMFNTAKKTCRNDTYFNQQWGMLNTAQYGWLGSVAGNDINACGAWNFTTGSPNVDIAIIDEGFENNHPDLDNNLENLGYSAMTGNTPTVVYGPHGTACAGIVAAEGNNNQGVAGVAYGSQLMSASIQFANTALNIAGGTDAQFADVINWSWINGAEVLSNSWGGGAPSALILTAITQAMLLGRGGLGSVVVFSTGNDNSVVEFPANSLPGIIAVGAMSPCVERKNPGSCDNNNNNEMWGSNFGPELDIVAPGVFVPTTDMQGNNGYNTNSSTSDFSNRDYTRWFNGTSSACPHVAGVAALMLSVNPCLSNAEVQNIIQRTGQKVGTYSYGTTTVNGTWNNEMGYGLLDAEAAVIRAQSKYLQNMTNTGGITYRSPIIHAGYQVNPFIPFGNYVTTSSSNVSIQASQYIDFRPGSDLQGTVNSEITSIGSCNTW